MGGITFSVKNEHEVIIEITINDEILQKNHYIPTLLERCFERVFQIIREQQKKDLEQNTDLEEDD